MRHLSLAVMLLAGPAHAAGEFALPLVKIAVKPMGARPAETALPTGRLLNQHLKTLHLVTVGGKSYSAAAQMNRLGDWNLVLIPEAAAVWEPAAVVPLVTMAHGRPISLGGANWYFQYDANSDLILVRSVNWSVEAVLPMNDLREAVYDRAVAVDTLGPQWRFVFQIDVHRSAGMRSYVFLEKTASGIVFHIPRVGVDATREVTATLGTRNVGLKYDGAGNLIVRPL